MTAAAVGGGRGEKEGCIIKIQDQISDDPR